MMSKASTLFVLVALLLQGDDAFLPQRRTTSSTSSVVVVAPWGVRTTTETTDFAKNKATQHHRVGAFFSSSTSARDSASSSSTALFAAPRIVIAGAPASGKGTQCEKIQEKFGVVHLSTGDMLRAAVAAGTDVGKEAKAYMDSGKLVPDSTIIGVVRLTLIFPLWMMLLLLDSSQGISLTIFSCHLQC